MPGDVVVGKGQLDNTCHAVSGSDCTLKGYYISQNSTSYYIPNAYLSVGLFIFKDTAEGMELANHIYELEPIKDITSWLEGVVLTYATKDLLRRVIDENIAQAFQRGVDHQKEEVRKVLF
jgi:hypothetical protein